MLRQEKGITLIALVVTIIILIILAAISIMAITGDHSIVSEAVRTKTLNAYNQIQEQEKLSYSSVRSKIMFETAKDSTYDARKKVNTAELINMLDNDFDHGSEFKFAVVTGATVQSGSTPIKDTDGTDLTEKIIYIEYTNTVIDQGIIQEGIPGDGNTTEVPPVPRYDVKVFSSIKLNAQGAVFAYDIEEPTLGTGNEFTTAAKVVEKLKPANAGI